MRLISIFPIAFVISVSAAYAAPRNQECVTEYDEVGVPDADAEEPDDFTALCRTGYYLLHDNSRRVPLWVIEYLTPERFTKNFDRDEEGEPFAADTDLATDAQATKPDYASSGYDRGHMAPAGDMVWDQNALIESFLLSNMAPQVGAGMNRGIWKNLESKVRDWTMERKRLYVYTGPIFEKEPEKKIAGRVAIPDAFYKIVYDPDRGRTIAFIMPNKKLTGKKIPEYIVSIDQIEDETGLDFLDALSERKQRILESQKSPMWK